MAYRNFINLTDDLLDKPIYRIMSIHRLFQILDEKNITLVKPKKWDDPFENALLNCNVVFPDGTKATISAKDSVYGQCWTFHSETDAMWRIYSHDKDGVRVTTTPRKLLNALQQNVDNPETTCFIGKVCYLTTQQLYEKFEQIHLFSTDGSGIAESLLYKRTEFAHENEVRLIYSGEDGKCDSDIFKFSIDPNTLIDDLLFDPRMDKNLMRAFELVIREKDYKATITKSTLYDAPKDLEFMY